MDQETEAEGPRLRPPAPGECRICSRVHPPHRPHDAASPFYQARFRLLYNRVATWADAVAHCPPAVRDAAIPVLSLRSAWSEPPQGVAPIPETHDE